MLPNFIPVLTTEAGSCLTAENWQEVGVDTVAYAMDSLLFKPGIELLKNIPDFATYMGWSGKIIINAAKLQANKEGVITLSSPYDGSKLKLTYAELFAIIVRLKPAAVIFPPNTLRHFPELWMIWDDAITPFIAEDEIQKQEIQRSYGIYFNLTNPITQQNLIDKVSPWAHLPRYLVGDISLELLQFAKKHDIDFIETNVPAQLALQGQVYSQNTLINLLDSATEMQCEPIDPRCTCPTCAQNLTKAYLHHLFLHTPLLCHRFLLQHNIFTASVG